MTLNLQHESNKKHHEHTFFNVLPNGYNADDIKVNLNAYPQPTKYHNPFKTVPTSVIPKDYPLMQKTTDVNVPPSFINVQLPYETKIDNVNKHVSNWSVYAGNIDMETSLRQFRGNHPYVKEYIPSSTSSMYDYKWLPVPPGDNVNNKKEGFKSSNNPHLALNNPHPHLFNPIKPNSNNYDVNNNPIIPKYQSMFNNASRTFINNFL